jgi:hypothetical protein
MSDKETAPWMQEAAARFLGDAGDTTRCPICSWRLAESAEQGCVIGNCSYRTNVPEEQEALRKRRERFERLTEIIAEAYAGECTAPAPLYRRDEDGTLSVVNEAATPQVTGRESRVIQLTSGLLNP